MKKLSVAITSDIRNIVSVQNFVEHFTEVFRVPKKLHGRISLATIEAVNNSIIHGNQNDRKKYVNIEVWMEEGCLFIAVQDEGQGFDYNTIPDPTTPDNILQSTGRGLYLMKALSDNLTFENNGARAIMAFEAVK